MLFFWFDFNRIQFPLGEKLPLSNNPVALFGQVPRFQREQELEYFLSKQCNSLGIRIQNKLLSVENHFLINQALNLNEPNAANINNNNINTNQSQSLNNNSTNNNNTSNFLASLAAPSSSLASASNTTNTL